MKPLKIRNLSIGSGRPKICVSLTEPTREGLISAAKEALLGDADLIEWRVDFYESHQCENAVREVLSHLRLVLGDVPLLFTFRTAEEGGNASISSEAYESLNRWAIESKEVDLIDLELFRGEALGQRLIDLSHKSGKYVIMSNHDFEQTPPTEEIIKRLTQMEELGADIVKIALMPNCKNDVLTLMEASVALNEANPELALVTMSMGEMGFITRIAGAFTGSCITFGAGRTASAPGQIASKDLLSVLEKIQMD